ncbi:MAG TPA: hypothetical protein VEW74_10600 [Candidatus Nitrosotalea sp.]|nr:hypothetical protein [Candidatus Nitrosotalea sp.]
MLISSFLGRPLVAGIALLSTAAILGGCSGSQSGITPQTPAQVSQARSPINPDKNCTYQGHIKVAPCSVTLTVSAPTATATVKTSKLNAVGEMDNCGGASGMATVTQNPSNSAQWIVTAGATTGSCSATFTATNKHGKVKGQATLNITNNV